MGRGWGAAGVQSWAGVRGGAMAAAVGAARALGHLLSIRAGQHIRAGTGRSCLAPQFTAHRAEALRSAEGVGSGGALGRLSLHADRVLQGVEDVGA